MNRALARARYLNIAIKIVLLTVAAALCGVQSVQALPKKAQQELVDTDSNKVTQSASGEYFLYSKVIDTYRTKELSDLKRAVALMLKAYPRSVHSDNAIYLEAELSLEKGQYQNSLDSIELLIKTFPLSNKRVSALYLKAKALKETKQTQAAELAIFEIKAKYPGSPEAAKLSSQRTIQQ